MRSQGINVEPPWKTGLRAGVWSFADRGYGGAWGASFAPPGLGRAEMMALGALVAAPLALLLLPDSFRRARIRRLHILRGAAYALGGSAAVVVCIALPQAIAASNRWALAPGPFLIWASLAGRAIALAGILWLWLYWFCFARDYLRLRPAWAIALVVLVIALLAPPALAALILGPRRFGEWLSFPAYGF